jgi:hypothetical protein
MITATFQKIQTLRERHARWIPIAFFGLGFVFDAIVLKRIDELATILQQAAYLLASAVLIGFELTELTRELRVPAWLARPWKYREEALHFLLGTLLNSYTIFYFKSASTITSFAFILILVTLLTLNEFKRFGSSQARVHVAFWSLCLVSYFASLSPILLGAMGTLPFLAGMAASVAVFYGFYRILARPPALPGLRTRLVHPFVAIAALFTVLYFAHAIPPVPLSVSYLGIFHGAEKVEGEYRLAYNRPWWKFWQHGDQTFYARPGDVIHCFARVYSPARFSGQLKVLWMYRDPRQGWIPSDTLPLPITGGREEGFRGVTQKSNFQPGKWQVRIETPDDREVGRIGFEVVTDDGAEAREVHTLIQ